MGCLTFNISGVSGRLRRRQKRAKLPNGCADNPHRLDY